MEGRESPEAAARGDIPAALTKVIWCERGGGDSSTHNRSLRAFGDDKGKKEVRFVGNRQMKGFELLARRDSFEAHLVSSRRNAPHPELSVTIGNAPDLLASVPGRHHDRYPAERGFISTLGAEDDFT